MKKRTAVILCLALLIAMLSPAFFAIQTGINRSSTIEFCSNVAQLNRDASRHIDEGRKASKSDLVRLIGRSNISESMLILNNIDAGFMIAPEVTKTGERYLGIQRIKIRYRAGNTEFVFLPFVGNSIKLAEDYNGIANYKTNMNSDSEVEFSGAANCRPSNYRTNAIRELDMTVAQDGESNIFHSNVVSGSNALDTMASMSSLAKPKLKLIEPMTFFN